MVVHPIKHCWFEESEVGVLPKDDSEVFNWSKFRSDVCHYIIVLEVQEHLGQVMIMFLQESQYCSLLLYVLDCLLYYLGNWSSHLVWFLVLNQTELIVVLPVPLSPRCSL